ncbi:MAG: S41 family peptidase [Chitinophagales bacterium]
MANKRFKIYLPLLFAVVMAIGMQLGFNLYETLKGKPSKKMYASNQVSPVEEIINYIDAKYVDEVDKEKLMEEMIRATLNDLDPHSYYISSDELQAVNENLQGNFEGIGIEFAIVKDTILVVTPIVGGPSESLGIQAGDKIINIEDSLVAGVNIKNEDVGKKLRGEKGSTVDIDILRSGTAELMNFEIKRDKIPLHSLDVGYMLDEKVGYIKINRFSATTYEEFYAKLKELNEQGMEDLILDLRQNPGGYLKAAVDMADEFISGRNLLVYTEGKSQRRKDYRAQQVGLFENGDLVVMVDEGSASASEIVAGAVQDWDRGTIVGRRSFGKGLVQEQDLLSNGSALRLTIARYHTPSGRCIQKSYEEGTEAYRNELNERLEDGGILEEDSIDAVEGEELFKTLVKGRSVFGGGGIRPDVFVPLDTTGTEHFLVRAKSLIPNFVYEYYANNKTVFENYPVLEIYQNKFKVDDALMTTFRQHLKDEIDFVDDRLLEREKEIFKILIKAHLARQLWQSEGFYSIIYELDDALQVAHKQF